MNVSWSGAPTRNSAFAYTTQISVSNLADAHCSCKASVAHRFCKHGSVAKPKRPVCGMSKRSACRSPCFFRRLFSGKRKSTAHILQQSQRNGSALGRKSTDPCLFPVWGAWWITSDNTQRQALPTATRLPFLFKSSAHIPLFPFVNTSFCGSLTFKPTQQVLAL